MTVSYVAGAYTENAAASLNATIPAHNAGDFATLILGVDATDNVPNTPTGWTKVSGAADIEGTIRWHKFYSALGTTEASATTIAFAATGSDYMLSRVEIYRSTLGGMSFLGYQFLDTNSGSNWILPTYTGAANVLVGFGPIFSTKTITSGPLLGAGTSDGTVSQNFYGNMFAGTYRMTTISVLNATASSAAVFGSGMSGSSGTNGMLFALAEIPGAADVSISIPLGQIAVRTYIPVASLNGNVSVTIPEGEIAVITLTAVFVATSVNVDVPLTQFVMTSYTPSVSAGGDASITVPKGLIVVVGNTPTITADRTISISVPVGSIVITTEIPTLHVGGDTSETVYLGNTLITGVYVGETEINEIYKGSTLIWSK